MSNLAELITKDHFMWLLLHGWKPFVEIFIIAVLVYMIVSLVRGTRTVQLLKGIVVVTIIFIVSQKLELYTIEWLLTKVFAFSVIALLIIFQPELRRALANIGQDRFFLNLLEEESFVTEICKAVGVLSKKKIGALIVIERATGLRNYIEGGIVLDSKVSAELIITIFMPTTPLHDGAVIVQGERLAASGCLLPLTNNPNVSKTTGTRHRAAIGITEESDAIAVVVSEKTGIVSLVMGGKITRDLDSATLEKVLVKTLLASQTAGKNNDKFN
jgi:diadenylate cyclase